MIDWVVDDFGTWHVAERWTLAMDYVTTFCGLRLAGAGRSTLPQRDASGPMCDSCAPQVEMRDAMDGAVEQVMREMGLL